MTTIRIETYPWMTPGKPMGLRVEGFIGERRICRLYIRDTMELPWLLGRLETIHGLPVDFDWEMS